MLFKRIKIHTYHVVIAWVIIGLLVFGGCNKAKTVELPFETVMKGYPVAYDSNGLGYQARYGDMDLFIASEQAEVQPITDIIWPDQPGLRFNEIVNIDFKEYLLIIGYFGFHGYGGAEITIEKVTQTGREVDVIISTIEPNVGDRVTVHPTHAIVIKTSDFIKSGNLTFRLIKDGEVLLTRDHLVP
jgi:hypothetical protein